MGLPTQEIQKFSKADTWCCITANPKRLSEKLLTKLWRFYAVGEQAIFMIDHFYHIGQGSEENNGTKVQYDNALIGITAAQHYFGDVEIQSDENGRTVAKITLKTPPQQPAN